jgi:hypothetical protein
MIALYFLRDAMDAGHHRATEHLHDNPASFSARFSLHSDVLATAANRIVDPVGIGQCAAAQEPIFDPDFGNVLMAGIRTRGAAHCPC